MLLVAKYTTVTEFISAAVWLMDNGANKDALDLTGKTAYDYAAEKGYTEIAELLRSD